MFKYHNKTVYLRTSHVKLIQYMLKSPNWYGDGKLVPSKDQPNLGIKANTTRLSTSFKYVAECSYNPNYAYEKLSFIQHSDEKVEQLSLFELEPEPKLIKNTKKEKIDDTIEYDIDYQALIEAGLLDEDFDY